MMNNVFYNPPPRRKNAEESKCLSKNLQRLAIFLWLCVMSLWERTLFQLDGAPPHFTRHVRSFLAREFPDRWIKRVKPIPCTPSFSRFHSSGYFLREICKIHCLAWKSAKCEWVAWQQSELQSALPMKCLSAPVQKLNIVLMCVVPLIVPILMSTEHIRGFEMPSVWKCINFCNTLSLLCLLLFEADHVVLFSEPRPSPFQVYRLKFYVLISNEFCMPCASNLRSKPPNNLSWKSKSQNSLFPQPFADFLAWIGINYVIPLW